MIFDHPNFGEAWISTHMEWCEMKYTTDTVYIDIHLCWYILEWYLLIYIDIQTYFDMLRVTHSEVRGPQHKRIQKFQKLYSFFSKRFTTGFK